MQFQASATTGAWTDVGDIGSGAVWRGHDNSLPADGTAIGNGGTKLSDSNNAWRQTYEEEKTTAPTPRAMNANSRSEWVWILQPNSGTTALTTYYFRMVRSNGTALEAYSVYPSVRMENQTPSTPTGLGPTAYYDNTTTWIIDNTPTFAFSLADPDTEQQVRYRV